MNCPICGNTLRISKKDPRFALCDECRKKFRIPQAAQKSVKEPEKPVKEEIRTPASSEERNNCMTDATQVFSRREVLAAIKKQNEANKANRTAVPSERREARSEDGEEFHLRYANIPPKEVREKQEREMRKAYDELLSIGKEEREQKKKRGFFGRRKG